MQHDPIFKNLGILKFHDIPFLKFYDINLICNRQVQKSYRIDSVASPLRVNLDQVGLQQNTN